MDEVEDSKPAPKKREIKKRATMAQPASEEAAAEDTGSEIEVETPKKSGRKRAMTVTAREASEAPEPKRKKPGRKPKAAADTEELLTATADTGVEAPKKAAVVAKRSRKPKFPNLPVEPAVKAEDEEDED